MRLSAPTPTADPLPYDTWTGASADPRARLPLSPSAIAGFDALLHELNPDAARVEPDRLHRLINWLLTLPDATAQDVLERRLQRIDELRMMLLDPDWDTDAAMAARLGKLFAYIDRDDDLIADHEPLLGLLDDVLLIELSWPAFADEAEEYRDFSAYRTEEHPAGSGDEQRAAWVRDRLAEIALWRHKLRVNDSHYVHRGHPEDPFKVV
jgi:hypothetical protein